MLYFLYSLLLASFMLILCRILKGPTVHDRIMAINSFGTGTLMLLLLLSTAPGKESFIDIALIYGLLNLTLMIAISKHMEKESE